MPAGPKKYGRNKPVCDVYKNNDVCLKNKAKKLRRIDKGLSKNKGIQLPSWKDYYQKLKK